MAEVSVVFRDVHGKYDSVTVIVDACNDVSVMEDAAMTEVRTSLDSVRPVRATFIGYMR